MFRKQRIGWLGIDIGTTSVKVAQLARWAEGIRVLARSHVPRSSQAPATQATEVAETVWSAAGEIRAAFSLADGFRGRQAAVVMPMRLCDIHHVENIVEEDADLDTLVRRAIETVTQSSADHLQFDIWPAESLAQEAKSSRWNVLAVGRPWSDQVYRDVLAGGFACRTIDGLPHTLARAVSLVSRAEQSVPVAALDWGFSQATFCIVAEGCPVYVRNLKECGLHRTLETIAGEIGVSLDEAHLLLAQHGIRGAASQTTDEVSVLVADLLTGPLRQLEQELARTLSHVSFQRRSIAPRQLMLFGGGALTNGVDRYLTRRLRLETRVWSLESDQGSCKAAHAEHDCLYGSAMALSALAWDAALACEAALAREES